MSASTARSIPIAAASMAASIASRARPMPISAFRRASISRPGSSPSRRPRACWPRSCRSPATNPLLLAMGTNTDPYQPIEREMQITRGVLEVLSAFNHPVGIVTKSALVLRDVDILAPMAAKGLAGVTHLRHHARSRSRPQAGAARRHAAATARDDPPAGRCRHSRRRAGRAHDPGAERHGDGKDPRGRRKPVPRPPDMRCCACRWRSRISSPNGSTPMRRARPSMC